MAILCGPDSLDWTFLTSIFTSITALVSIFVSIVALKKSSEYSRRNINTSIQQSVFKMVQEKAKECNKAWDNEPEHEMNDKSPHFLIATEIIVAIDLIEKAFDLFSKNDSSLQDNKSIYFYLYWKQLKPDIRGWIMNRTMIISKEMEKMFNDDTFTRQVITMHKTFGEYFENQT